jgi:uncharacterized protein YkwD
MPRPRSRLALLLFSSSPFHLSLSIMRPSLPAVLLSTALFSLTSARIARVPRQAAGCPEDNVFCLKWWKRPPGECVFRKPVPFSASRTITTDVAPTQAFIPIASDALAPEHTPVPTTEASPPQPPTPAPTPASQPEPTQEVDSNNFNVDPNAGANVNTGGQNTSNDNGGVGVGDFVGTALGAHNDARGRHGASPLSWDDDLAGKAQIWASRCQFEHSGGALGPFGENLAAGQSDIGAAVGDWMSEAPDYQPSNPQGSHFSAFARYDAGMRSGLVLTEAQPRSSGRRLSASAAPSPCAICPTSTRAPRSACMCASIVPPVSRRLLASVCVLLLTAGQAMWR